MLLLQASWQHKLCQPTEPRSISSEGVRSLKITTLLRHGGAETFAGTEAIEKAAQEHDPSGGSIIAYVSTTLHIATSSMATDSVSVTDWTRAM